jgi:acyl carrier protein
VDGTAPLTREQVEQFTAGVLVDDFSIDRAMILPGASMTSLGLDSLDLVEIAQIVQDKCRVRLEVGDVSLESSLGEVVDLIVRKSAERGPDAIQTSTRR